MANVAWDMPEGMDPGLEASAFYDPPNFTYPSAHISPWSKWIRRQAGSTYSGTTQWTIAAFRSTR